MRARTNYSQIIKNIIWIMVGMLLASAILLTIKVKTDKAKEIASQNTNPLNNVSVETKADSAEKIDVKLTFYDKQSYENIDTYIYTFNDTNGEAQLFSESNIALTDLIADVNSEITNFEYRVRSFSIVGKQLFIQTDRRYKVEKPQQIGIMTVKDNILGDEWIKLLETINNTKMVYCSTLLNYATELGSTHYVYIYVDIDIRNIEDISDVITSSEQVEQNTTNQ